MFLTIIDRIRFLLPHMKDRIKDIQLGVHTTGSVGTSFSGLNPCSTRSYSDIARVLSSLRLTPSDVFIDIGCGRGRVLCCAALFEIRKVIGIEILPEQRTIAQKNALNLRGKKSPIEVLQVSAEDYDYDEGTIFYMYNPFKSAVMSRVLERIHQSLLRRKRSITIIYVNPAHESCLTACSWLRLNERWDAGKGRVIGVPVSFWSADMQALLSENGVRK